MAKFKDILTKENIENASKRKIIKEGRALDIINIGGANFINVHTPLDEYAQSIGAIPYHECKISKM